MDMKELLGAPELDLATKEIRGQVYHFGSLSAAEVYEHFEAQDKVKGTPEARFGLAKLVARSLVHPTTKERLCITEELLMDAVKALLSKSSKTLAELAEFVMELNGMTAKDAKEQAKNASGEAAPVASPTVLQ